MVENRSEIWSVGLKPRLGNIATPGRVCPPHNETYDCRIYPNGIGCLRRRSTRRRLGHRPADRTGTGIPGRSDIRTQRSSGPQRSVSDPGKQNASATCIFRLCCRKTREKREGERRSPSGRCIRPKAYRPPGDRIENAAGERPKRPRVQLGLAEPESEEARATGLRAVRVGLSRQKCRTYLPNTFLH